MNSYFVSSFIAFVLMLPLSGLVFFSGRYRLINQVYSLFLISLSFWIFGDFFYFTDLTALQSARFWTQLAHIGAVFSPTLLLHFIFLFTQFNPPKGFVSCTYLYSCILAYYNVTSSSYFFKEISLVELGVINIEVGSLYIFFLLYVLVVLLVGLILVFIRFKKSEGILKEQMKHYLFASCMMIMAGIIYSFAMTKGLTLRLDNLFLLFYTATIAYTITKNEMFNIQLVVSRSSSTVLVLFMTFLIYILCEPFFSTQFRLILILSCLLFSQTMGPVLREKLQTEIDIKFVKDYYNSEEVVQTISDDLSDVHNRQKIFSKILEGLNKVIQVKQQTYVFGEIGSEGEIESYSMVREGSIESEEISLTHPIIDYFSDVKKPIKVNRIPYPVRNILNDFGIDDRSVVIPLYSPPSDRLEGMLFVGRKVSDAPYLKKDFLLFNTLVNYARIALGSLRPYELIEQDVLYKERSYQTMKQLESFAQSIQDYNHLHNHKLQTILTQTSKLPEPSDFSDSKPFPDDFLVFLEAIKQRKDKILKATKDSTELVATSLTLAGDREHSKQVVECNINEFLSSFVSHQRQQLDDNVFIHLELSDRSVKVLFDQNDLQIIFDNLLSNSIKALKGGGNVKIKTSIKYKELLIEFMDDGEGISEEIKDTMFNMFVSNDLSKGTGLGLATVHRLVMENQGRINVFSVLGDGTNFKLRFPIVNKVS